MNCTVIYGQSRNIQRKRVMPVEVAFRNIKPLKRGWAFLNIYFEDRLVYTTQGSFRYECDDCPYSKTGKTVTREQNDMIYGG